MSDAVELWEKPKSEHVYMLVGWRQWADAGSVSSGLPQYLVQQTGARQIGRIRPDGFYLFQFPGTHDLVRPVIQFKQGFPVSLQAPDNQLFFTGNDQRGIVLFIGDEPHLDIDRYVAALLQAAQSLGVERIISFGGVYGELPYDKERMVSCIFSLSKLKEQINDLAVNLSDYKGGASIGSYLCRRAGEQGKELLGFYAFVPTYDFSNVAQIGNAIRVETDYMAWLGLVRRVNYLLKLDFDLSDLEEKSKKLVEVIEAKVDEIDNLAPQIGIRDYMKRISEEFEEVEFNPLDDVWEQEIRRLFDKFDTDDT